MQVIRLRFVDIAGFFIYNLINVKKEGETL